MVFNKSRAGAVCLAVALLCACSKGADGQAQAASAPLVLPTTTPELQKFAVDCLRKDDLKCAETALVAYEKVRPDDDRGTATLADVYRREGKDKEAIVEFQKVLAGGVGTYDVFAGYADCLTRLGRPDEAIDWSYKALKLVPSLVDVRGSLAKLLVQRHRKEEALALLTEFDQHLESLGHDAYFTGQRVAIESLPDTGDAAGGEHLKLRMVKLDNTYYAPVKVGTAPTAAFVLDTGATETVVYDAFLADSKVAYRVTRGQVAVRLADGSSTVAREVMIDRLNVGAFELRNVKALTCRDCELLLGVNVLSQFDLSTSKVQGMDVLMLGARDAQASMVAPHAP